MTSSNKKFHIKRDQLNLAIDDFFLKGGRIKNVNSFATNKRQKVKSGDDDLDSYYLDNPYHETSNFEPTPKSSRYSDFE